MSKQSTHGSDKYKKAFEPETVFSSRCEFQLLKLRTQL